MALKRMNTEVRKKQIVDAARKLIVQKGSEHLTVRGLAKQVGFSEAALYRHFRSKREVLYFLMENVTEDMLVHLQRNEKNGVGAPIEIARTIRSHLTEIEQRKGMSFQIIAEIISLGDKALNRSVYHKLLVYIDLLKKLLSYGVEKGLIRKDVSLDACATLLFGMIQGLVSIWALSGYKFDLAERYESLWAVYEKAILPPRG